jgi:ABC-2 type transport system permease protein
MLAVYTLWAREQVRFFRQRSRVFGAFVQPLLFWALFGAGLRASFRPPVGGGELSYLEYFFPGTVVLILLFTAIFSTISVIEDRREGFLQSVLVAPQPRWVLVLGKVLGGTTLALIQGTLLLALAPAVGIPLSVPAFLAAVVVQFLVAFALTALSFVIAWRMDSTQGFHAVMTVFLMPMWLLSGAFFPEQGVPGWLSALMRVNPLTYGTAALRRALYAGRGDLLGGLPSASGAILVTIAFGAAAFAAASLTARRRTARGGA